MPNQNLLSKFLSLATTALLIALFIYLLPSILVILGVIVLLVIIGIIVLRYKLKKNMTRMNFIYTAQNNRRQRDDDEIGDGEMKDVTNSSKSD